MERMRTWVQVLSLAWLGVHIMIAVAVAQQPQDQSVGQAVVVERLGELTRRLGALEGQGLNEKVYVLQSEMGEVKWLVRAVTGVLIGQLAMSIAGAVATSRATRKE